MSASVKITLLQKPACPAVHSCNYINATDAEYCSCSIYTADRPILTKEGEGKCTGAQASGEARGERSAAHASPMLSSQKRNSSDRAYPVKGSAKRQSYKNQGGLSDWLTQQHSVSRWYF